ncbi:MAG: CO dehydrogenase/CO-methylating acetyl-CoA synthase complex subunit beta [Methanomicrobiales archaeon]|nr:CO dehydrogenase/CO-methylating acetyl-CoA synthase complex subunit beta [Methanomicrobiales archaeon]
MPQIEQAVRTGTETLKERLGRLDGSFLYEETAYYLPVAHALTGIPVKDAKSAREAFIRSKENLLVAVESLVASREGKEKPSPPYTGFIPDTFLRKLGYSLVDGSMLGLVLLVGTPPRPDLAVSLCRELQEKYMLTFLTGESIPALREERVKVGLEYRLVPLGTDALAGTHFIDILARVAMMFGGVVPGDAGRLVAYARERAKAFVITFPGLSPEEIAFVDAMQVLGIPILSVDGNYEGGQWIPVTPAEAVPKGMELKGIKVMITTVAVPMHCSPAFEGKSIRKEEMYIEFGGGRSPAFEVLQMKPPEEVEDGRVSVIGPEIEEVKEGAAVPLGIIVDVSGKRMKKEFEPVLERRIHNFVNYGEGTWHVAQRNLIWVRFSRDSVSQGLRIVHLGKLIAAKFRMDFPQLLDAVQVTLITDEEKVRKAMAEAEHVYRERDDRLAGMKDDDVDTFYSCTLCQTFAPNHVCIITPQRLALCGAISWLDGRTAYEISPSGANQPVKKGPLIDAARGEYEGVNRFVRKASHGEVDRCSLYSLVDAPMTCCGCFECIAVVLPEVNGIMVVNREYRGDTPCGMSFSTLAGTIGGGAQTPGFAGVSKIFIPSERFFQAEEGHRRLVWMPSMLKQEIGNRLREALNREGHGDLYAKIADETVATTLEQLEAHLERVNHPAREMAPLL